MASEKTDPPAPQSETVTTSTTNNPGFIGPYVDPHLTKRNIAGQSPSTDQPPASGSTTLGSTRPAYASDKQTEIQNDEAASENAGVAQPAQAPNSWQISTDNQGIPRARDPYRNKGMTGQSFFNNQGSGG